MGRHVGFTGTQKGMTQAQLWAVDELLQNDLTFEWAHHGDCIGADADFHKLADLNGLKMHGHPPLKRNKRAFCKFDKIEEEKEYLDRNKDIVDAVEYMIACPQGFEEELRSGTWSTIRYARIQQKPGVIVWPDGKVENVLQEL